MARLRDQLGPAPVLVSALALSVLSLCPAKLIVALGRIWLGWHCWGLHAVHMYLIRPLNLARQTELPLHGGTHLARLCAGLRSLEV